MNSQPTDRSAAYEAFDHWMTVQLEQLVQTWISLAAPLDRRLVFDRRKDSIRRTPSPPNEDRR